MSPLSIPYVAEDFPTGSIPNGSGELPVTWDDILWAAVTVGRPNRHYVFRHGKASIYEAIFRWSLVRMALEQSGPAGYRLRRTDATKTLDPTEKGAVNYFLGTVFCKLFAAKLLDTPWLLHLDVWHRNLRGVLSGRSRPDLVGMEHGGSRAWHAFECKGRMSNPDRAVKNKAKDQALRLVSVGGRRCQLHIGAITYFKSDTLNFYWRDPVPRKSKKIEIPYSDADLQYYYRPILDFIRAEPEAFNLMKKEQVSIDIKHEDLRAGVHPEVLSAILENRWDQIFDITSQIQGDNNLPYQADGIAIIAGETWKHPFSESTEEGLFS